MLGYLVYGRFNFSDEISQLEHEPCHEIVELSVLS